MLVRWPVAIPADGEAVVFNPPKGCSEGEAAVVGFAELHRAERDPDVPAVTRGQLSWSIFPWVRESRRARDSCRAVRRRLARDGHHVPEQSGVHGRRGGWKPGYESQLCQNFLFAAGEAISNGTA